MSASLSPIFLADLADVYATLRPQKLSVAFLSDLVKIYETLPIVSDTSLHLLARSFDVWRKVTEEYVRSHFSKLADDDPLRCPISLFRTMDYGRLETAHTRALAWLLDPKGEHGFGTSLLVALLRHLSGPSFSGRIRVDRVESEYSIDVDDARGRLDVLAEGTWEKEESGGWLLLIEAKVDAWEEEDQLPKYETWLRSHAASREVFLVFLTPDGRPPETSAEEWESLSFLELVRIFRTVYSSLREQQGFHFLRFYLAGVLQDVCDLPCEVKGEVADPYAIAFYLKKVQEERLEGASHDATR